MPTDMTFRTDDLVLGSWAHVGRVWTSGEPFLVLDASLLAAWRGSEEQFEEVVSLGWEVATVRVGNGVAGIVATDGTVNDEGWLEIFQAGPDRLAVVQALGNPYRRALRDALAYPDEADDDGGVFAVPSGDLVLWSSALDGIDDVGAELRRAEPGPTPDAWEPLHGGAPHHPGGLQIPLCAGTFRLRVRWMTELDDACFARWLLTHQPARRL